MPPCVLITGGAGFIGFHAAQHFLAKGWKVVILDNLSRPGVQYNLDQLKGEQNVVFIKADIRKKGVWGSVLRPAGARVDLVLHLAAQVAVTKSVENPREDMEINFLSTFELLETVRKLSKGHRPKLLVFSSTNKVYGALHQYPLQAKAKRYAFLNGMEAINEETKLDFHSPYGCSKGAADQYIHDYSRIYHLPTVVLRQSCIYGTNQIGIEDQGWVAYFAIRALLDRPITIYGDGKQVRDLLYVDDLARLFEMLYKNTHVSSGKIYNVGGGPENTVSLLELTELLGQKIKKKVPLHFNSWRPGDQKIFISDITALKNDLGWYPRVSVDAGLDRMISWIEAHLDHIKKVSTK